jgi:hypothetical protein
MRTKLVSVLSLVAFASILGGCGAATARTTAWSPRYYPAPDHVVSSHCDVAVCDSHTSNPVAKL